MFLPACLLILNDITETESNMFDFSNDPEESETESHR